MSDFSNSYLEELFGKENIIFLEEERRSQVEISDNVASFLINIGLPRKCEEIFLRFSLELTTIPNKERKLEKFRILGVEYDFPAEEIHQKLNLKEDSLIYGYICINTEDDSIYRVSADSVHEVRFVNTDINCFGKSIYTYRENQMQVEANQEDDEFVIEMTRELERKLIEIDPMSFDKDENWWSSIFLGLLI